MKKNCEWCGARIPDGKPPNIKFCNRTCANRYNNNKRKTMVVQKKCPCGTVHFRSGAYCSQSCASQNAWRKVKGSKKTSLGERSELILSHLEKDEMLRFCYREAVR